VFHVKNLDPLLLKVNEDFLAAFIMKLKISMPILSDLQPAGRWSSRRGKYCPKTNDSVTIIVNDYSTFELRRQPVFNRHRVWAWQISRLNNHGIRYVHVAWLSA
jgi:hypothetical protein